MFAQWILIYIAFLIIRYR